jgi:hypothetical protein
MVPDKLPEGERAPDIRFHPGRKEFQTANAVSAKDPNWLKVSEILRDGAQFRELLRPLSLEKETEDAWYEVISDVAKRIRDYHLPVQTISVDDYETAAEIFNRVNTGGKPLSKGDLIMGAMAARWQGRPAHDGQPEVKSGRQHVEEFEASLKAKNWPISREVLLRIMSVLSPAASPNHTRLLELKNEDEWRAAWEKAEDAMNHAVGFLRNDAGIPASSLLPTQYAVVLPAVFLQNTGGAFSTPEEGAELVRWVLLASAFGHYSGSVETRLAADINTWRDAGSDADALAQLVRLAQDPRTPDTALTAEDILEKTRRSPFLKLLQIAAVRKDAKSWWSHRSITYDPDHRGMAVEIHHVFPRNWLKKQGLGSHPELDTLANFAFLSKHDNIRISDGDPGEYLRKADEAELRSQWIPTDPDLWTADRFTDFCARRRQLLADELNQLLGLTEAAVEQQPLNADEAPEPEVGAWADDELGEAA